MLRRHVLGIRYRETRIHDYRLVLDLDDPGISTELAVRGAREPEHAIILEQELRPGDTVLDVGANIGYYAVMMARLVGCSGRVYALEPCPENYHLLNLNVRLNVLESVVETLPIGVSHESGIGRLHLSEHSNWHSFLPGELVRAGRPDRAYRDEIDVATVSLPEFLVAHGPAALIRMDLEGYEVTVLRGLIPALVDLKVRPKILFETHAEFYDTGTNDIRPVLEALVSAGYSAKYLVSDGHFSGGGSELFRSRGYTDEEIVHALPVCDRAIYARVSARDAIDLIHGSELVHAALLVPEHREL